MVFINSLDDYDKVNNFAILLKNDETLLVINKFSEPIIIDMNEINEFLKFFQIKSELLNWICENMKVFQNHETIVKELLFNISYSSGIEEYSICDGTTKMDIKGENHIIELIRESSGSQIHLKNRKNRTIAKLSISDKKTITTTCRSHDDLETELIILFPKDKYKKTIKLKDIVGSEIIEKNI